VDNNPFEEGTDLTARKKETKQAHQMREERT
jgi:hypothetical protein